MTVRVMLDAQLGGDKVAISSWMFSNRPPYIDRNFEQYDPDKNYLFKCKVEGCGCTEFESLGGGMAQCDNCETGYVFGWEK